MDMGIGNVIVSTKLARRTTFFGGKRTIRLMRDENGITCSEDNAKIVHKLTHNELITIVRIFRK